MNPFVISHRGNINGHNLALENNPHHIKNLLNSSIHVEIDVWCINNEILLGHDTPQYKVDLEFLRLDKLWCHAKNINALTYMLDSGIKHCFWHQQDDFALTSSSFIWTFPNNIVTNKSIIVDLDPTWKTKKYNCWAVCTDFI